MNDWLYLLLIPALLCLVWFWPAPRQHHAMRRSTDAAESPSHNAYHAVSIQPCTHACNAVNAMRNKRFLASEVVTLPVPGCNALQCKCTYKHHSDRRTGEDRRHASIAMEHIYAKDEHRSGGDRRRRHAYQ